MKKEIKFRAWVNFEEKMYPVEQWANKSWVAVPIQVSEDDWELEQRRIEDIELMQYTGLKDKNGKEIYEGDIVVKGKYPYFVEKKPNYRGIVEWYFSGWQVSLVSVNNENRGMATGYGLNEIGIDENKKSDWQVIGNIYENDYLLSKK